MMGLLFLVGVDAQEQDVYNDCEIYGNCRETGDNITIINGGGGGDSGLIGDGVYIFNDSTTLSFNITLAGTNLSANHSNITNFLDTNLGFIGDVNETQIENDGGVLTIIMSFWDGLYCRLTGCIMTGNINLTGNDIVDVKDINMTGEIISQNPSQGINEWFLNSTDPQAVSVIGAVSDEAFATLMSIGSQGDPPTSTFTVAGDTVGDVRNDSGLYCSGGRCFIINNGVDDIIFGHIQAGDNNFTNASFSLILQENGTLIMQGPIFLNSEAIFFDFDEDHFVRVNKDPQQFNGIAENATWFGHKNPRPEGEVTYLFTVENKTKFWLTAEKNNSVAGISNSVMILPDYWGEENFTTGGIVNMTDLTDYPTLCATFSSVFFVGSDVCRSFADTRSQGLPLLATGQLEVWLQTFLHNGILARGDAVFSLNDNDFNIFDGSLLIQDPVTFQEGFDEGDQVTILTESFTGGLGAFTNLQTDAGNWFANLDAQCGDGECANANGISGTGTIFMQTNFSTFNLNETQVKFVYSLQTVVGGNTFNVYANNNSGSGDVLIFSDSGTELLIEEIIDLSTDFENISIVSLEFECDVTNFNRECFVDNILVNATAAANTLANVSSFDSVINFGDGDVLGDGFPARGIFYEAENDTIFIRGEAVFETIIDQTLNVTNNIILGGESITNWDNVSSFDQNVLLVDGSRELTDNWDAGDFNITMGPLLTFENGETIDNVVDGEINISANVTMQNLTVGFIDTSLGIDSRDVELFPFIINANRYVFSILGAETGLFFTSTTPRGLELRLTGAKTHKWMFGSPNNEGAWFHMPRLTEPTSMCEEGTYYINNVTGYPIRYMCENDIYVVADCEPQSYTFNDRSMNSDGYMDIGRTITGQDTGFILPGNGSVVMVSAVADFGAVGRMQFSSRFDGVEVGASATLNDTSTDYRRNVSKYSKGEFPVFENQSLSVYLNRSLGTPSAINIIVSVGVIYDNCIF